MDSEDSSSSGEQLIAHLLANEVRNSQISQNKELEYNPFSSQDLFQAGPSNYLSQSSEQSQKGAKFLEKSVPLRKRRGRPPRHVTLSLKPTRESQRLKKGTTVLSYDSFQDVSWQWSERDKHMFLAGCLKVGIQDIEGLKKFLPHKTERDIRSQIMMWKEVAWKNVQERISANEKDKRRSAKTESLKNLSEWIKYFKEQTKTVFASTFVISNLFTFIAEYGTFPSPKECGGIDVRAMYRYIHCMMNGLPPYGLNRVTARVLLDSIDNVMEKLNDPNFIESMEEHLFDTTQKPEMFNEKYKKTYSRERVNPSKGIDQILKSPIYNPLYLRKSALSSEILEDSGSESDDEDNDDDENIDSEEREEYEDDDD